MVMPLSVFRFAPTLCRARFSHCDFPESISTLRLKFTCLKQLILDSATITKDVLQSVLSGCTGLESLELSQICVIGGIFISSQTLRSLAFSAQNYNEDKGVILQLVIKDAPALERLLPLYSDKGQATIQIIQAPKLEILGCLSERILKVQFGTTIFEKNIAVGLTTKIQTIKVLVLDSVGPNLDVVLDFLKCFPCLVTLCVISHPTKDIARKYTPLDPIECLELSLKKVVLVNYDGSKRPSFDFARFFILNTKSLEEMHIELLNDRNDKWVANQHRQLTKNRASPDARIELKISNKKMSFIGRDPFDNRSAFRL